jgi:ABC-type glycerol-3-phosphate transport system permease component
VSQAVAAATTAGYALSVLKPRFHRVLSGLVLATLFVPALVLLVPLYLTVVGLLLLAIGLTGLVLSFGLFERLICGAAALVGVILCIMASRVSTKPQQ